MRAAPRSERERDAKSIQDNIEKGYVKKLSEEEVHRKKSIFLNELD